MPANVMIFADGRNDAAIETKPQVDWPFAPARSREPHNSSGCHPCLLLPDMAATTPYIRDAPFLRRIWKGAVDVFSPSGNGDRSVAGDQSPRAIKRRRTTDESPGLAGYTPLGPLFQFQFPPLDGFEKALRIEVLKIGRGDGYRPPQDGLLNGSPLKKETPVIKARCKILICTWKPGVECRVLHCDSQICTVREFRDSNDVCRNARVYLPQPFEFAADKLCVQRDDDKGFELADTYLVIAELESAGDPNWPPRLLLQGQENLTTPSTPLRQWVLTSQITYTFAKGRETPRVKIRKRTNDETETDLRMDMDLRWSSCTSFGDSIRSLVDITPPSAKSEDVSGGVLEPLTNGHVNGRTEGLVNGHAREHGEGMLDDDDDEIDGEATTPSRSLRTRGKPQNYNLKLLSDKARGKEAKERKRRKAAEGGAVAYGHIIWKLPVCDEVPLENWSCIRCFAAHSSYEQLKAHTTLHPEFHFSFEYNARGDDLVVVSRHGQQGPHAQYGQRTPRSSRSAEPPDPDSWDEPESDDDEHSWPLGTSLPQQQQQQAPLHTAWAKPAKPKDTKQAIPVIKQPVFDRLSKCRIEPGSLVDEPQVDNTWLLQKHRDIIKDYSDVPPDEKEYIAEWDAFSNKHKAAAFVPHLDETYLQFLQEKAPWLAAQQHRLTEAMKHMAYLKARGVFRVDTFRKAIEITRQARLMAPRVPPAVPKPASPPRVWSKSGCKMCGKPVLGPNTILCANEDCDRPMYHVQCIQDIAQVPVKRGRHWRCNDCYTRKTTTAKTTTVPPAANAAPNPPAAAAAVTTTAAAAAAAAAAVPTTATAAQAPVPAAIPALAAREVAREDPVTKRADTVSESHKSYGQAVFVLAEPDNMSPGPGSVP